MAEMVWRGGKLMYDELIAALRNNADHYGFVGENGLVHILTNAADAIEALTRENKELSFRAAQLEVMNDALIGETGAADALMVASKPRWIPVTERLPKKTGTYLAWMKWDLTEADEEPSAYPVLYDADAEGFGWWKSYYDGETFGWAGEHFVRYEGITHWMPLPEPPKEG